MHVNKCSLFNLVVCFISPTIPMFRSLLKKSVTILSTAMSLAIEVIYVQDALFIKSNNLIQNIPLLFWRLSNVTQHSMRVCWHASCGTHFSSFFTCPICFNLIKIVLSLTPKLTANFNVICDGSASTITFKILRCQRGSPVVHGICF